jgi:hypothetical protein
MDAPVRQFGQPVEHVAHQNLINRNIHVSSLPSTVLGAGFTLHASRFTLHA